MDTNNISNENPGIGTWSPIVKSGQGGCKWDGDGSDGCGDGGRFDDGTSIWGSPAQQPKTTGIDWIEKFDDPQSKTVAGNNNSNPAAPSGIQKSSMLNSGSAAEVAIAANKGPFSSAGMGVGASTGGDSFARAPGPTTSNSLTAKPFGVAQRASTWSSFGNSSANEPEQDWPKITTTTAPGVIVGGATIQSHPNHAFDLNPHAFDAAKSGWNTSSMLMKGIGDDDTGHTLGSPASVVGAAPGTMPLLPNAAVAAAALAAAVSSSRTLPGTSSGGGQYEASGIGTWSPMVKSGQGGCKWDTDRSDGRGNGGRIDDGTAIWGSPSKQANASGVDWAKKFGDPQPEEGASSAGNDSNDDKSRSVAAGNNQAYRPQQQQSASSTSLLMSSSSSSNTSPSSSQHNRNQSSMKQASSLSHNFEQMQQQQSNALLSQTTQPNKGLGSSSKSSSAAAAASVASSSSSASSSWSSNVPSTQQLRHMVQQIQIAVQAGHLDPQILNQPLSPITLQLLYQLLQQIKVLHQLQMQASQQFNKLGNHPATVNVHITKTKQNILNLRNQIAAQQAVYLKQTQAHNISSTPTRQPTMPSLATGGVCLGVGGLTLPPGISQSSDSFRPAGSSVSNFHTGTVSVAPTLINSFSGSGSGLDGMSSTANGLATSLGHMGLGSIDSSSSTSSTTSRFDQPWRAPASKQHHPAAASSMGQVSSLFTANHSLMNHSAAQQSGMQKSMLNSGTGNGGAFSSSLGSGGDSFARAPGPTTSNSLTAKPFGVAQRASTWSSFGQPSSADTDSDWPKSTTTSAPGASGIAQSHTNAIDLVPEFEPGKPWRGSMLMKSVEDDPTMTPGSMARSLAPQRKTIWSDEILQ